jgi:cytochrome P450
MFKEPPAAIAAPPRDLPSPRSLSPLGALPALAKDPIRLLQDNHRRFGDAFCLRLVIWKMQAFIHPDQVQEVLQENYRNYHKSVVYEFLKPIAGAGLLTSEDDLWLRQRRILQPAFHRRVLGTLIGSMTDETSVLLDGWQNCRQREVDVLSEMMALTLAIISRTMLSTDVSGETDTVRDSVSVLRDHVNYRMMHFLSFPDRVPTPRNRRFASAIADIERIVYRMIEDRRSGTVEADDLLSMLLGARDEETDEGMSDKQIRDEVMTIFLAGHETTANALAWALYLLALHPDAEERLGDEVDRVLNGRTPTPEDLQGLPFARMVLEESLRLYPPAWAFGRQALVDHTIGGFRIAADTGVLVSPWLTHRHPEFWDEPERFDPERFLSERTAARPRYAYFPFGGGPRQCIGNEFALMEGQLILAMIAQSFRLRLVPGRPVEPEPAVTLRPKGGLPMTVTPRS